MTPFSQLTPTQRAERFATALNSTMDRYLAGQMRHGTWVRHMVSIWNQVNDHDLVDEVMQRVDPAKVGLRPRHETKE